MCPTSNLRILIECLVSDFFQRRLFPLLIGLGLVTFLWGVFRFVKSAGDEKSRGEGKKLIVWGIVGLFVMTCVWALVSILVSSFGGSGVFIPQVRI